MSKSKSQLDSLPDLFVRVLFPPFNPSLLLTAMNQLCHLLVHLSIVILPLVILLLHHFFSTNPLSLGTILAVAPWTLFVVGSLVLAEQLVRIQRDNHVARVTDAPSLSTRQQYPRAHTEPLGTALASGAVKARAAANQHRGTPSGATQAELYSSDPHIVLCACEKEIFALEKLVTGTSPASHRDPFNTVSMMDAGRTPLEVTQWEQDRLEDLEHRLTSLGKVVGVPLVGATFRFENQSIDLGAMSLRNGVERMKKIIGV